MTLFTLLLEVEVSRLLPTLRKESTFLFWTKTPPKPGSSLNPDDGKEGDDVNLECKTQKLLSPRSEKASMVSRVG